MNAEEYVAVFLVASQATKAVIWNLPITDRWRIWLIKRLRGSEVLRF